MLKKEYILLAACCFLLACSSKKADQNADAQPISEYPVLTLQPQSVTTSIKVPATIQGQQVVEIRPMIDGYIENIYVQEGAVVTKGQLLFKIRNPQYEQALRSAEAAIKSAQADVSTAEMNLEKVKPLVEQDIVSSYELKSAKYTLEAKRAALAEAKATLINAQANVGYTIIRSPQNGVISTIPYKVGALVSSTSTDALTTMSNTGNIFAYISMDEKQLLNFQGTVTGKTLQDKLNHLPEVSLMLADGTIYPLKGKLETASGIIDTETGSLSLKATFPNSRGVISSGASGTVVIPFKTPSAIVIPQSATYELQDKRLVYIVADSNKVKPVGIKTSATDDGQYFIVSNGLKQGDKIVTSGITGLKDGVKIKPIVGRTDTIYNRLVH